ncbi:flavin-containing monooxygenase [Gordonia rubripertincta]|uniref:NAD(P)/FAD-dependent oxidoreductase n=1 Tax=Gordonia rubripertincta TaxID=36822 RepID=A0ABT4MWN1_GORRU|nr:NAD(P)/FAD-dependent oxidoreductase [Gordonia rubripertincta]MCZ4551420.1 NAD(P)/FAD-dependent oxidoreductase [Gordonia rubripertincta]
MSQTISGKPTEVDAVIVGAGLSGLYMLYKLRRLGITARVCETGPDVGGTWYWNKYPGARCDVQSMHYSYSFDDELEQEWEWTEKFPGQPELLKYIQHVADRHDLRRDIQFNTRVTSARFQDDSSRWSVKTEQGEEFSAQYFIMAVGCLSRPKALEVPGLEMFTGQTYHTASWPETGVDFTGRRVAVIGTGSSGIQAIPLIAQEAAELTVFQRTANYCLPTFNGPIDQEMVAHVKANYSETREADRNSGFGVAVEVGEESAFADSDEERRAKYQDRWNQGNLTGILQAYSDVLVDVAANDTAAEFVREQIRQIVTDPRTADMLSPKGYPFGTKRPCLGTGYYETFNRENVRLVDLRETPLIEITDRGVRTSESEFEVDALVLATGFDAMTGSFLAIDVRGRDGVSLQEKWVDGPSSYLGISVPGFPNMFTITGPGSPSVLSNMLVSIEQHVDWLADMIAHLQHEDLSVVESTEVAAKEWDEHVKECSEATLYAVTESWYMGANVPGKPRVFMPYSGGVDAYRDKCNQVAADGYPGFDLRSA